MIHIFGDIINPCLRIKGKVTSKIEQKQLLNDLMNIESDNHEIEVNFVGNILRASIRSGLYYQVFKFMLIGRDYGIDIDGIIDYLGKAGSDLVIDVIRLYEDYKNQIDKEMLKAYGAIARYEYIFHLDHFNQFLLKNILKKDIDLNNICCNDIDKIVDGLEKDKVPGVLYTIAYNVYQGGNDEVFYYIYSEYLFPILIEEDWWESTYIIECKKELLGKYILLLNDKIFETSNIFCNFKFDNSFWDKVVKDLINKNEDINILTSKEILRYTRNFGSKLFKLFEASKDYMKNILSEHLYSFFASMTVYMLQAENEDLYALDILIENYRDIVTDASPYKIIMLAKGILASNQFNEKNILYGYYLKEQTEFSRKAIKIHHLLNDSCNLFEEMYQFISDYKNDNSYNTAVKKYLKDTVFEEWGLYSLSKNFYAQFSKADDLEKAKIYNNLIGVLKPFNDHISIDIKSLCSTMNSINNIGVISLGHSDILKSGHVDNIFPWEIKNKVRNLCINLDKILGSINSLKRSRFFNTLDLVLKDLISDALKEEIDIIMKRIKVLREGFIEDLDEEFTKLWDMLSPTYDKMRKKCVNRNEIIEFYYEIDRGYNCWHKLDDECKNMLITAEIVYRTLSSRADAKELDYSASMIPLTKVLEKILNNVYHGIKYNIDFNNHFASENDKRYFGYYDNYKGKWKPKSSLELGPAIRVLCDGIIKIEANNEIKEIPNEDSYRLTGQRRRELWEINSIIDWTRLSRFAGNKFNCIGFNDINCKNVRQYEITNDIERNIAVFISALEYIKNAYRNKVAHKEGIDINKMNLCRNDMLLAQKLIWILVYIIKD